jgi:DNA-binding response OmpR family regulator
MNLPVEIITGGKKVRAVSQDLSPFGMFIRLSPPLPAGTVIQVVISPTGQRYVTTGQVTHSLNEVEARTLGRFPGIGVQFREPMRPGEQQFLEAVARLLESHAQARPHADLRILVADSQTRILERLSTALGSAGFIVATATNGSEAIGACLSKTPDVALIERDMPVVNGLHVLQEMGRHRALASVPVMMMSANATDLARLQAFQLGAADFIPKPFTVLEVILRARRWARASQRDTERIVLRGTLAEINLPTLLQMFEQEKKTGQLSVMRDQLVAWIDFVNGQIVCARSSEVEGSARDIVLNVLDWKHGYFELTTASRRRARSRSIPPSRTCCSSTRVCTTKRRASKLLERGRERSERLAHARRRPHQVVVVECLDAAGLHGGDVDLAPPIDALLGGERQVEDHLGISREHLLERDFRVAHA